MGIQVDLFSVDGTTHLGKVPQATGVAIMEELNGDGNATFSVARNSPGAAAVLEAAEALVVVSLDGSPVGWGVLDQDSDDAADKTRDARAVKVTAPGTASLLGDAVVWWWTGPTETQREFTDVSPGQLMWQLIEEAQFRGALQGITWTFSDTEDSAGTPWPNSYTRAIDVGYSLRALLGDLASQGLVDFRMEGLELSMFVPDTTLGTDRPDVIIEPPWLTAAPRQRSRAGKVTHMLGMGELVVDSSGDLPAYTRPTYMAVSPVAGRRREALTQFGGVTDAATVQQATLAQLATVQDDREGYSTTYLLHGDRPRPWSDYGIGHKVRRRDVPAATGDGLEPLRIRTMSVELEDSGATAVTLELNDVFLESDLLNKQRLDALTGGGMGIVGGPIEFGTDLLPPAQLAAVVMSTDAYLVNGGTSMARVAASWLPVTHNADGTLAFDVVGYELQWRVAGDSGVLGDLVADPWEEQIQRSPGTTMARSGLPVGVEVQARARAVDRSGNGAAWRESAIITTAEDTTPPQQPSEPDVSSHLGVVTLVYDGKNSTGGPMDPDTAYVEVHRGVGAYVPVAGDLATRVGTLRPQGGTFLWGDGVYDVTYQWRLLAVDWAGNASDPSVAVADTIQRLVDVSNFPDDAMEELYARTGHFLHLTADNFEANLIEGAWIKAGAFEAKLFTGLRIRTSATDPRVEIDSLDDQAKVRLITGGPHEDPTQTGGVYGWHSVVSPTSQQDYVYMAGPHNTTEPGTIPAYVSAGYRDSTVTGVEYGVDVQAEAIYLYGPTGFMGHSTQVEVFGTLQTTDGVFGPGAVPIGGMLPFAGSSVPFGWLLCNGATIAQVDYPDLYVALGNPLGGTVALPDLRGRFPIGAGSFAALRGNDGLSESLRSPQHAHDLTAHSHPIDAGGDHDHGGQTGTPSGTQDVTGGANNAAGPNHRHDITSGGSHAHGGATGNGGPASTQTSTAASIPYYGVNYIIRAL